jgi:hypothetical protein
MKPSVAVDCVAVDEFESIPKARDMKAFKTFVLNWIPKANENRNGYDCKKIRPTSQPSVVRLA